MAALALDSVDSPSDFHTKSLVTLDETLRCPICNEFFTGCISLHCGHSFCSECIRNALSFGQQQRCPTCAAQTDQGRIRPNTELDKAVRSWRDARPRILELDTRPAAAERTTRSSSRASASRSSSQQTPIDLGSDDDGDASTPSGTRRKREGSASARVKGKGKPLAAHASSDIEIVDEPTPRRASSRNTRTSGQDPSDPNLMVNCPLCDTRMPNKEINKHLNKCTGEPAPKPTQSASASSAWASLMPPASSKPTSTKSELLSAVDESGRSKHLPLAAYNVMTLKKVRASLDELGLPATAPYVKGRTPADELEFLKRRHREFTIRWNANCDTHPDDNRHKTEMQLKKELLAWETLIDKSEKKDIKSGEQYQAAHESEFAELTRKARESARAAREQQLKRDEDEEQPAAQQQVPEAAAAATSTSQPPVPSSTLTSIVSPPPSSRPTRATRTVAFADVPPQEPPQPPKRARQVEAPMVEQSQSDSDEEDEEGQLKFPRPSQRVREEEELWKRRAEEADEESSSGSEAEGEWNIDEMDEDD